MMAEKSFLINDAMSDEIVKTVRQIAMHEGAHNVSVSRVLSMLDITNRVFYNRFRNIDEVLELVYKDAVYKMHESLEEEYGEGKNFFEYVMDVAVKVLINTYDIKKQFSRYMFDHDSLTEFNFVWWTDEIKKLIEIGKAKGLIADVDTDMLSYTVWCYCRGFNADAVGRRLSKEEAIKSFKYGFGCFLEGVKIKN